MCKFLLIESQNQRKMSKKTLKKLKISKKSLIQLYFRNSNSFQFIVKYNIIDKIDCNKYKYFLNKLINWVQPSRQHQNEVEKYLEQRKQQIRQQETERQSIKKALIELKREEHDKIRQLILENRQQNVESQSQLLYYNKLKHDQIAQNKFNGQQRVRLFWEDRIKTLQDESYFKKKENYKLQKQNQQLIKSLEQQELSLIQKLEQSRSSYNKSYEQFQKALVLPFTEIVKEYPDIAKPQQQPDVQQLKSVQQKRKIQFLPLFCKQKRSESQNALSMKKEETTSINTNGDQSIKSILFN